jgi:hypothetical protein
MKTKPARPLYLVTDPGFMTRVLVSLVVYFVIAVAAYSNETVTNSAFVFVLQFYVSCPFSLVCCLFVVVAADICFLVLVLVLVQVRYLLEDTYEDIRERLLEGAYR